jgi:hypothetical protein
MQAQLQGLVHKRFIADTEYSQLAHFPRYLKAMNVRLEKLRTGDPARDAQLMAEWQTAASPVPAHHQEPAAEEPRPAHDGLPLDAGRAARVAVRAGAAHADAGVEQAPAKGVGVDAAGLGFSYEAWPGETHATIYHPAALKAFRAVLKPR